MIINFTLDDKSDLIDMPDDYKVNFVNPFIDKVDVRNKFMKHLFFMLRDRNYKVDGINIELLYSSHSSRVFLSQIYNNDFSISLHSDGIHTISIPKIILEYFDDTDTYVLYKYVGDNWNEDKDVFMNGVKCNSRLYNEKKIYIRYNSDISNCSECKPSINYHKRISRLMKLESILNDSECCYNFTDILEYNKTLVYNNDLDREYSPDVHEPSYYYINDILFEVFTWLYNNVYLKIKDTTESQNVIPPRILFKKPEKIQINNDEFNNYTYKLDTSLYFRYNDNFSTYGGILMPILRFVSLSTVIDKKLKYANIAYDACFDFKPLENSDEIKSYLLIKLKFANHVYVYNLDENTINGIIKSIVPINEYKSNYKNPIILVRRGLYAEEFEIFKDENDKNETETIIFDDLLNF